MRNKLSPALSAVVITAILSSSLIASEEAVGSHVVSEPTSAEKSILNNFYTGVGLSRMYVSDQDSEESFSSYGLTLHVGYELYKYISFEGRYSRNLLNVTYDSGKTSSDNTNDYSTTMSNLAIYAKPTYPFESINTNIYLLLGAGAVMLSDIEGADRAEVAFQWGFGVSYDISKAFNVYFDYTSLYSGTGFDYIGIGNQVNAGLINTGLKYSF